MNDTTNLIAEGIAYIEELKSKIAFFRFLNSDASILFLCTTLIIAVTSPLQGQSLRAPTNLRITSINGVPVTNQPPTVNAGSNQTITLPASASLNGTASDDGLPAGSTLTTTWSKVSGPGTVTFGNIHAQSTTASFSTAGPYVLQLAATDSALTTTHSVTITVNAASPSNQPPTVSAGSNQTITLPASASLNGTASDDGLPTGSTLTTTWSEVSGPGTVTFGNVNAQSTTASFSTAGTYMLQLAATDSALTTTSSVTITVNAAAPVNQPPTVNAGSNQTITLPASASLNGTASDDGLPTGSMLTTTWSKVSGPGTVSFGNVNAGSTTASFSTAGTYVLQLAATDSALTTTSSVTITVNAAAPVNQPPTVNAGSNQTITLPASASLNGTATDDGLPTGSTLTTTWSKVSGPGTVTFGNVNAQNTTASFSTAGTYELRLTATDSALTTTSSVTITVNAAPPVNQPPTVNAGSNQTITLPASASLNGTATDDGLPTGSTLTTTWSKVNGPGTVTFGNVNAQNTTASFSAAGTYVLRLTATDSVLTTTSSVTITVNAAPPPDNATQWSVSYHTPYDGSSPVGDIDWAALTHVGDTALLVNSDGSLSDIRVDSVALIAAAHANNVKVLLNIAGIQSGMASAVTYHLSTLVNNIISQVDTYGYDGVDIDWEVDWNPATARPFFAAMRTALGSKLLTADAFENSYADYTNLHQYLDRVNVMTFSMGGTWNPYSWFNSPLYGPTPAVVDSIDLVRTRYLANGVPAAKLNIGIPFYGRMEIGGGITGPRQSYKSPFPSFSEIAYKDIVATYNISNSTRDAEARVPWIPITNGWLNYDDAASVTEKVKYAIVNNLGGWIIWSIDKDYIANGTLKHPLLDAVKNAMGVAP
jgi:PKD repeat protein